MKIKFLAGLFTAMAAALLIPQSLAFAITQEEGMPTLTVVKVVVNDDGGTKIVSDFPLFICQQQNEEEPIINDLEATPDPIPGYVCNEQVVSGEVNDEYPGNYHVTEIGDSNYTSSFSGDCDSSGLVNIQWGDHKTCTITNNDNKRENNGGGGGGGRPPNYNNNDTPAPPANPEPDQTLQLSSAPDICTDEFRDLTGQAAQWVVCNGIGEGYNDNQQFFSGTDDIRYGHFVKLLVRGAGLVQTPHEAGSGIDQYLQVLENLDATHDLVDASKKDEFITANDAKALASAVAGFNVNFEAEDDGLLRRDKAVEGLFAAFGS